MGKSSSSRGCGRCYGHRAGRGSCLIGGEAPGHLHAFDSPAIDIHDVFRAGVHHHMLLGSHDDVTIDRCIEKAGDSR